jgi:hypothetical protein
VTEQPRFAHASEAELARILDYYDVRWHYEPHTFPIMWNLDGTVVESFSPDFYLPELDLYIELTTLRQSLVRRKNRKLRRLRELYPDVRIKLFYGKDFKALMLKYGRFDIAASLSGLEGQAQAQLERDGGGRLGLEAQHATTTLSPADGLAAAAPAEIRLARPAVQRLSRGMRRRRARRMRLAAPGSMTTTQS